MFRNDEYVKWANEETVHVLSYSLDPNAEKAEPMIDGVRDGKKTPVFKAYPMFTEDEMYSVLGELGKRVTYPTSTPWAGVLDPADLHVLAEVLKGTPKDFRAAYEAEQKKRGTPFPRATWLKVRAAVQASADAENDGAWRKAVESAIVARDAGKASPKPLQELIDARLAALDASARSMIADAAKEKDAAARAKALAKIKADFAGLPVADQAK